MKNIKIAIIGLGYIGLPLAIKLSKYFPTIGYDLSSTRIGELKKGLDRTAEVSKIEIKKNDKLKFTDKINDIKSYNFFIVAVPSPIKKNKTPDFYPLKKSCSDISKIIKKDDICVFESTVYPGTTEEILIPIIEKNTKYKLNKDFFVGYSPERANPGDKIHKLENIKKVISGSNKKTIKKIHHVYSKVIKAGLHIASSIKVAEASKVVENAQRDLNIALTNELAMIFDKMKISTSEVLDAAATKWNFIRFEPGLVGGHCIAVDPYYLTFRSQQLNQSPKVILAGREINDNMHKFVGKKLIKNFNLNNKKLKFLILGYTFKENCPDIRNTKSYDLVKYFLNKNISIDIYDPWVKNDEINLDIKKYFKNKLENKKYDAIIISVKHKIFSNLGVKKIKNLGKKNSIVFDLKNLFPSEKIFLRL
jgi:UDP-N-acetyl-D-galactosamine dehydrogenase